MRPFVAPLFAVPALLALFSAGCNDDNGSGPQSEDLFSNYASWDVIEYTNAPSAQLGGAHQGADPEYTRRIFANPDAAVEPDGEYSVGAVLVKETFTYDANHNFSPSDPFGLLAMVKRDAGFDDADGNWEYFNLDPTDLTVIDSGANLGSCKSCHVNATQEIGTDYIFAHPYQYEVDADFFSDYATWSEVDAVQGTDAFLGAAHAGNNADAVRRIYKKQLNANPDQAGWGYPVGTAFLKTVEDGSGTIIGKTAMVKRGGDFDAANGGWEYFMWDPVDATDPGRGDSQMMATCFGCHQQAGSSRSGKDLIFAHTGDPFNNG